MLASIAVLAAILCALAGLIQAFGGGTDLIARRPYNNPHSDASAARDGRLLG